MADIPPTGDPVDWITDILASLETSPEPPPLSTRVEWPLLAEAAVLSGFLPEDLGPGRVAEGSRPAAEQAVLGVSNPSYGNSGPRWVLEDATRVRVIGEAAKTGTLVDVVNTAAERLHDPLTIAMRDCLQPPQSRELPLPQLEAQRAALSWLAAVPELNLPAIADLDREITRRRMLGDFARMVGRMPDSPASSRNECFFGRTLELQRLTDHVGADFLGSVTRLATRAVGTDQPVMTVWGVGGVGKTTLMSKFMLRQAEAAQHRRFPYAYIDFDRATVTARDRAGLLLEICTQVMSQFAELASPLQQLKARIDDVALKMASRPEGDSISLLRPLLTDFRTTVDRYLAERESRIGTMTPFLLVFDTFEIVQYTPDDAVILEDFVAAFSQDRTLWPRLRLVISGRKRVAKFLGTIGRNQEIELGVLDPTGSVEMLMDLAKRYDKPISERQASGLVEDLARVAKVKISGVQPLRLKLVGSLFRSESGTGPEIVESLRKELNQPLTVSGLAGKTLVDGVLIRRVLGHVKDARVRALSDPGLVVRYITADVIKHVMAPGTPDPTAANSSDGSVQEMWNVSEEEAKDIFRAFKNEVTLVEDDPSEPNAVHHRPDVRLEMLPLIRARSGQQFERLHQLAYDYFRSRERYAGEAIYHGLWLKRPLDEIDQFWRRQGDSFDPRIDPDEFPDDAVANIYLRAKRGAAVAAGELPRLPRAVALDWVDARGSEMLGQRASDEAIDAMHIAAGHDFRYLDGRPSSSALLARLFFRAGRWQDSLDLLSRQLTQALRIGTAATQETTVSMLRTWSTVQAKAGRRVEQADPAVWEIGVKRTTGIARVDIVAHMRLFAEATKNRRQLRELAISEIDDGVAQVGLGRWSSELRVLRLAILTSTSDIGALIDIYAQRNERLPRDPGVFGTLERLLKKLDPSGEALEALEEVKRRKQPLGAFERLDDIWRRTIRARFLSAVKEDPELARHARRVIAFDHGDWRWVLGNALSRELKDNDGLASRLASARFIPQRRGADERDGLSIAQAAVDSGRMLELARTLDDLSTVRFYKREHDGAPQDVYGIAKALLDWHALIERVIDTDRRAR